MLNYFFNFYKSHTLHNNHAIAHTTRNESQLRDFHIKPLVDKFSFFVVFVIIAILATSNITFSDTLAGDQISSKIKTVAVFPFEVISKEDNSFIGKGMGKMLCSRISSDNTIQVKCIEHLPSEFSLDLNSASLAGKTAAISELNGVDYILAGTVTIAGSSVSTDARLIELLQPDHVKFFSAAGTGVGDIMQHASSISEEVKASITGKTSYTAEKSSSGTLPLLSTQAAPAKSANAAINQNPPLSQNQAAEPQFENKGGAPLKSGANLLQKESIIPSSGSSILLNRKFNMEIRGIATADIDGDGRLDIAFMDAHTVSFFIFENNALVKKGEYNGAYYNNNIALDSIDSNGNGRSELFITSIGKNNYLKSYVLEWNGREIEPIVKDSEWYFRVVALNGKNSLIGQQRGHDELFSGAIHTLDLSANKILKREKIAISSYKGTLEIFGFAHVPSASTSNTVTSLYTWFDNSGVLNLGDNNGNKEWKSPQSFGSTALFIEQDMGRDNLKERIYINSRVFAADIDNDGTTEIITVNNSDVAKGYLSGYRKFNQGYIKIMAWKNGSMVDIWQGNPVTGYISDFNIMDMDGDGYPELIYAAITDTGIVMNKAHSTVFIEKIIDRQK